MEKFTFLNHACFISESEKAILMCDPWFEGNAFNNGWSLLTEENNNDVVINFLKKKNKPIYIWYSHEHSDHFSVNFVNSAIKLGLMFEVIYKETIDKRLLNFFKKKKVKVNLVSKKKPFFKIDDKISIYVYEFSYKEKHTDDSFALIQLNQFKFLNLNDCEINTSADIEFIKKKINYSNIDILFSQFSYAGFCEPVNSSEDRLRISNKIIERTEELIDNFNPNLLVPFASFIYFSNSRNFYMNDQSNNPEKFLQNIKNKKNRDKICFIQPFKSYELILHSLENILKDKNDATKYWSDKFNNIKNLKIENLNNKNSYYKFEELNKSFLLFLKKIYKNFYFYMYFLRAISFCKNIFPKILADLFFINKFYKYIDEIPLVIKIKDLNEYYELNYIGINKVSNVKPDLVIYSDDLKYCFDNEFGFNALEVNCKAEILNNKAFRYFRFIYYLKDGFNEYQLMLHRLKNFFKI